MAQSTNQPPDGSPEGTGGVVEFQHSPAEVRSFDLTGLAEAVPDPLPDLRPPQVPGSYLLFYQGGLRILGDIADGRHPVYVGSATDLARRMVEHRVSLRQARNLHLRDFSVILATTSSHPSALYLEALLVDALHPPWNATGVEGFGSKPQGRLRGRGQTPTPWDRLHPGRTWATAPVTARLRREAEAALKRAVEEAFPLDALRPTVDVGCDPEGRGHGSGGRRQTDARKEGKKEMTVDRDARSRTVLSHLQNRSEDTTIAEVASQLDITHRQARDSLAYLARNGQVTRVGRGTYRAANGQPMPKAKQGRRGRISKTAESTIRSRPDHVWTARELADELGIKKNHATAILAKLVNRGVMGRVGYGRYQLGAATAWHGASRAALGWEPIGKVDGSVLLRDSETNLWLATPASVSQLIETG